MCALTNMTWCTMILCPSGVGVLSLYLGFSAYDVHEEVHKTKLRYQTGFTYQLCFMFFLIIVQTMQLDKITLETNSRLDFQCKEIMRILFSSVVAR